MAWVCVSKNKERGTLKCSSISVPFFTLVQFLASANLRSARQMIVLAAWKSGLTSVEWCFAGKESNVETKPTSVSVHIRWMIRRDMPAVLGIETACFEFAWNEEDFIRCLRQRNCIGMVAEEDDQVVGFMIYELHKNRLHILNFAVHPAHRRSGIGLAMINKLLGKLSHERRNRIMLEVRETNLEAQLFFKSVGFRAISVLRDFYDDTVEDAYLMQFRYQPSAEELAHPHNRISKLAG